MARAARRGRAFRRRPAVPRACGGGRGRGARRVGNGQQRRLLCGAAGRRPRDVLAAGAPQRGRRRPGSRDRADSLRVLPRRRRAVPGGARARRGRAGGGRGRPRR
ncbi:hypothetical protein C1878_00400 [Gordonibacter sp. 28C]|nr:hypothetical protein C1878_00400 [Gordonibacter sp. 28C]